MSGATDGGMPGMSGSFGPGSMAGMSGPGGMGSYLDGLFTNDGLDGITRNYDFSTTSGGMQFSGTGSISGMGSSSLGFNVGLGTSSSDWMSIGMSFSEASTGSSGSTSQASGSGSSASGISLSVCGMFEFSDDNGDGSYTPGTDTIVNSFTQPSFTDYADISPSSGDYTGVSMSASDGMLGINMYVANSGTQLSNGVSISANEMKFDVVMNNLTYTMNGTMLAFCASLSSEHTLTAQANGYGLVRGFTAPSGSGSATGYFTWTDTADSDNGTVNILATQDDSGNVYFTFTNNGTSQPTMINWDPSVGVTSQSSGTSTSTSHNGAGALMVSLLSIVAIFVSLLI